MDYPWQNTLYIDPNGKTIPYQAPQAAGPEARGFINLKKLSGAVEHLEEIRENIELKSALVEINSEDTKVFSVGCHAEKAVNNNRHQASGYLEFAVNDQALVSEATTYFAIYFQFQNRLALSKFPHAVKFEWVILPAVFTSISHQGFTCSVKINTAWCPTQIDCKQAWAEALALVTTHLLELDYPDVHFNRHFQSQIERRQIY